MAFDFDCLAVLNGSRQFAGQYAGMTNYEVVIRRGDGDPVKVVLETRDAVQAEALYQELRGAIEEGKRVKAPAVELSNLGPASIDLAVNPAEVTSIDLIDADDDPSPAQYGPTADYGEG